MLSDRNFAAAPRPSTPSEQRYSGRYHYDTRAQLAARLSGFLDAYNFARRLKTRGDHLAHETICNAWTTKQPDCFRLDPTHFMAGLNT